MFVILLVIRNYLSHIVLLMLLLNFNCFILTYGDPLPLIQYIDINMISKVMSCLICIPKRFIFPDMLLFIRMVYPIKLFHLLKAKTGSISLLLLITFYSIHHTTSIISLVILLALLPLAIFPLILNLCPLIYLSYLVNLPPSENILELTIHLLICKIIFFIIRIHLLIMLTLFPIIYLITKYLALTLISFCLFIHILS